MSRNISDKLIDTQGDTSTWTCGSDSRLYYQNGTEIKKYLIEGEVPSGSVTAIEDDTTIYGGGGMYCTFRKLELKFYKDEYNSLVCSLVGTAHRGNGDEGTEETVTKEFFKALIDETGYFQFESDEPEGPGGDDGPGDDEGPQEEEEQYCPNCGASWNGEHCDNCGQEPCPNCGEMYNPEIYCENCGYGGGPEANEDGEICPECGEATLDENGECPNCHYHN